MAKPIALFVMDNPLIVLRLADGTLMSVFVQASDQTQEVVSRLSKDNGASWGEPERLLERSKGPGSWIWVMPLLTRDGEVHLFIMNDPAGAVTGEGEGERVLIGELTNVRLDIWYARSSGARTTWSSPRLIWKGYTGALNSVIQMTNGRILLPFSWLTTRAWDKRGEGLDTYTFMGQYDCTVIYSDDGGATWAQGSNIRVPVPDIVSAYGAVEPMVLQLKDRRVWMLIRTQQGRFYESFSDDGAIWSSPRPTSILSSDSPAGLTRLDDGRIVLFWNNCLRFPYAFGGRHVIHAAISDDEGQTWRGYREVARDPRRLEPPPPNGDFGTGYPFPTTANDGKVLYCTGQGKGRVLLMQMDPNWLLETSQKADFDAGEEEWAKFGTKGVEFSPHPEKANAKVLELRRIDADWPAAAVWNFPSGRCGQLRLRMMVKAGSGGVRIGLTDHFSVPFDLEDRFYNLFNLELTPAMVKPNVWHDLELNWDLAKRQCQVLVSGQAFCTLPLLRETVGVSYLRLSSLAQSPETGGTLVESAEARVEA